jgi:hypothetical protein
VGFENAKSAAFVFQGFASLTEGRLSGKYPRFDEPRRRRRFSIYPMHLLEPTVDVLEHC